MEDIVSIDVGEVIRARGAGFTEREASTLGSLSLAELLRTKGIFWFRSQRGLYASELIRKLIDEWLTASDEAFLATLALDLTTLVGRGLPDKIGDLRAQVVVPLSCQPMELGSATGDERAWALNRLTRDFAVNYCTPSGEIDWKKLVEFVSKNMA